MLIASSPTINGINKCIKNFYYATEITLQPINDIQWSILNKNGKIQHVHVEKRKNRFYFETTIN